MKEVTIRSLSVLVCLLIGVLATADACAQAGGRGGSYLPLAPGMKWVLRSPAMQDPVVLEVLAQDGDTYRVRFDNPWTESEMTLLARDNKYYVTLVKMGGQAVPMQPDTLYFDLTALEGATWQNSIGTLTVTSRRKRVRVGGTTHADSIQIKETTRDGNELYWTFASGIGFVQFGEGSGAFVLDPSASSLNPAGRPADSTRAAADPAPRPAAADTATYLPAAPGARWTLRSPASQEPVVFEVLSGNQNQFALRFDNPWVDSTMSFEARDGKYYVTSVDMGAGAAPMPQGTLYFDFTASEGTTWRNRIGTLTVVSRRKSVATPGGTYENCIQIREVTAEGRELFWTFAPGVGFVQFGEGAGAFVLAARESPLASRSPGPSSYRAFAKSPLRIALAANPPANEPFNEKTARARYQQSLDAGVTYHYLSPKWDELERGPGAYNWKDLDAEIARALESGLPIVCNVRVVDTGNRAVPADLEDLPFDHPQMRARLRALLTRLLPRMKDRAHLLLVGNEVDAYFRGRPAEVAAYARLFDEAREAIREWQAATPVSISITFEGVNDAGGFLKPLLDGTDFFAVTYYPLNPDFTFRDPGVVSTDFSRIVATAAPKKILLQEIGYSSSPLNKSSEEQQARFYANVFDGLRQHRDAILGASFLFMSDLSDAQVDAFAKYYNLPGVDRFKAFLRTLGLFDQQGRPKTAWKVFRDEARGIQQQGG